MMRFTSRLGRPYLAVFLATAWALLLCAVTWPGRADAQKPRKALERDQVIELLESGVTPTRVAELARDYGIAFEITEEVETQLRDAGATDELLATLRELASHPAAPPAPDTGAAVLLIEATPGGAEAYIDDEPVGTTSSEGRLKLSKLSPGAHRVRISLRGFRDYEQSVQLVPGQTVTVAASLQSSAGASSSPNPLAGSPGTASPPAPEMASLGAAVAARNPSGAPGLYIQQVVPGGPADKAGLRPGYTILTVGGRRVTEFDQLQRVLASHQPGDVVDITYSDGQAARGSTRVQLVSRSTLSFPPQSPAQPASGGGVNPLAGAATAIANVARFSVAHDHGGGGANYCLGELLIGNGRIAFRSANGAHSFDFPLSELRDAKKNAVYLAMLGGFHIRFKKEGNFNFVALNAAGQPQAPDDLLMAITHAAGGQ
jgi:hypothetical protein